jgi:uncharacterized protein (TIGR00369 family)
MTSLSPAQDAFIRNSFARQSAMTTIRASLHHLAPGQAEIHLPVWDGILQQVGFVHGGVVGMIADSAAGYAALTCAPEGAEVLTVEYKINMMAPATGTSLLARGRVIRTGRTLIVTSAEVLALSDPGQKTCALMQQTIMVVPQGQGRAGH